MESRMSYIDFRATLSHAAPPQELSALLRALWLDQRGDFAGAHGIAQDIKTADAARVHAYLHRKEGDLPNARYWYARAGCEAASGELEKEWEALVRQLLVT